MRDGIRALGGLSLLLLAAGLLAPIAQADSGRELPPPRVLGGPSQPAAAQPATAPGFPAPASSSQRVPPPAPARSAPAPGVPAPAVPAAAPPSAALEDVTASEDIVEEAPVVEEFGEVVVTARRMHVPELDIPRAINIVEAPRIRELGVVSVVDALTHQIGVWVEKRTSHASDPVMRGLSGSNLLATVDGNTLSTFWGEGGFAGDDMYGKIDAQSVDRIEVVRGPSSVLYGSNALGGVINFIMKESPYDFQDCGVRFGGRTYAQVNTAPSGWRLRQEFFGASRKWRWFGGVSYIDLGTTRDGSGQVQTPTAARGWYGDVALNWKVSEAVRTKFTVQVTDLDPLYKYYRPTQDNQNWRLAVAGWLEFPDLSCRVGFADHLQLALYYQEKTDRRRWFNDLKQVTKSGVAKWKTLQADLQAEKQLCNHGLIYGIEFEGTDGESPDDEQFTMTQANGTVRKDAPDSVWWSVGAYALDEWKIGSGFSIIPSARVDYFRFSTTVDENYVPAGGLDPSVDEISDGQWAFAGGLTGTWHVGPETSVYGGWTRGFRQFAPRFGVTEHAWGVVVPNEFLEPVTGDQFELGLKHRGEYVSFDAVGYYTLFNNFQNVIPGTFQGQDWYDYNGNGVRDSGESVYVNVGSGNAYLYGIELALDLNLATIDEGVFGDAWTIGAGFMWNYGQDETNDIPMRHTHPMRGLFKVRWEPVRDCPPSPWVEFTADFADRFDRIPPDRLAKDVGYLVDPQDPDSGMLRTWGLPGYSVFDIRVGVRWTENIELSLGLNNILDKLYRPAHARWDAPGRNFYASLSIRY